MIESARIARGKVSPLHDLDVSKFDALFIPGGFGVAKNLSDFADKNEECTVIGDLESILKKFHAAKKPIGMCCIAPVLAARCLPGVELTMGGDKEEGGRWPYTGASQAATKMGAKMVPTDVKDIHVDQKNIIVTTAAYMCDEATVAEVYDGIGKMVEAVIRL